MCSTHISCHATELATFGQDAMLRGDASSMTRPVSKEELPKVDGRVPTHRSAPASNKRKGCPSELHQLAYYTSLSFHTIPLSSTCTLSKVSRLCITAESLDPEYCMPCCIQQTHKQMLIRLVE